MVKYSKKDLSADKLHEQIIDYCILYLKILMRRNIVEKWEESKNWIYK